MATSIQIKHELESMLTPLLYVWYGNLIGFIQMQIRVQVMQDCCNICAMVMSYVWYGNLESWSDYRLPCYMRDMVTWSELFRCELESRYGNVVRYGNLDRIFSDPKSTWIRVDKNM
jgi:hypothetical protein